MTRTPISNPNQEQIDFWNSDVAQKWVTRQDDIDAMMTPFTQILLGAAHLGPSGPWRILDVGCGGGETSLLAAQIGHHVTGIDVSSPLLNLARSRAKAAGPLSMDLYQGDASRVQIDPPFDLIMSRFGIMFFQDPIAAFTNLARLLTQEGRFVGVCWQAPQANAWVNIPMQALKGLMHETELAHGQEPGPFALADPKYIAHIMGKAGFRDLKITPFVGEMVMGQGKGFDAGVAFLTEIGPAARESRALSPTQKQVFEARLKQALIPYVRGDALVLEGAVWLIEAVAA